MGQRHYHHHLLCMITRIKRHILSFASLIRQCYWSRDHDNVSTLTTSDRFAALFTLFPGAVVGNRTTPTVSRKHSPRSMVCSKTNALWSSFHWTHTILWSNSACSTQEIMEGLNKSFNGRMIQPAVDFWVLKPLQLNWDTFICKRQRGLCNVKDEF